MFPWSGNPGITPVFNNIFFGTFAIFWLLFCWSLSRIFCIILLMNSQTNCQWKQNFLAGVTDLSSVLYACSCFFFFFILATPHYHDKDNNYNYSPYRDPHPHRAGYGWAYFASSTQDFFLHNPAHRQKNNLPLEQITTASSRQININLPGGDKD